MGGQVESHTQALLARRQVLTVKCIAGLDSAKAGILPDCPWALSVHAGIGSARIGKHTRILAILSAVHCEKEKTVCVGDWMNKHNS